MPEAINHDINHTAVGRRLHLMSGATTFFFRIRGKIPDKAISANDVHSCFLVAFWTNVALYLCLWILLSALFRSLKPTKVNYEYPWDSIILHSIYSGFGRLRSICISKRPRPT